jgi:hypothetical protein
VAGELSRKLAAYFRTAASRQDGWQSIEASLSVAGQPYVSPVVSARHSGGALMEKDYLQVVLDGGGAVIELVMARVRERLELQRTAE